MTDNSFWPNGSNMSRDELILLLEKEMEECDGLCCDFESIDACLETLDKEAPLNIEFNPYASLSEFKERIPYENYSDLKKQHNTRKVTHKITRYLIASVLIFIISGSVIAQALGLDIVKIITAWTETQFNIVSDNKPQITDCFYDLNLSLDAYNVKETLVPTWLPEGYEFVTLKTRRAKAYISFTALFKSDNNNIIIDIKQQFHTNNTIYEKDNKEVSEITVNNIVHCIMSNNSKNLAVWENGSYLCSITGDVDKNQLERIIKSIYER